MARAIQAARYSATQGVYNNAQMPDPDLDQYCPLEDAARKFLLRMMSQGGWSARSYNRILKVSRSIADLAGNPLIQLHHVAEAVHFRSLDKPVNLPTTAKK
jgi:magnesium chelatase family protein